MALTIAFPSILFKKFYMIALTIFVKDKVIIFIFKAIVRSFYFILSNI